jgi:orotidine-5'-phosphate decarboxylase
MTAFGGIIAFFLGKIGLTGLKTAAPSAPGAIPGVDVLLKLKDKISDPATRAGIDGVILQAVQSGIPGLAIQSGASLVPGIGPLAAQLEPLLRKVVTDVLEKRVAQ